MAIVELPDGDVERKQSMARFYAKQFPNKRKLEIIDMVEKLSGTTFIDKDTGEKMSFEGEGTIYEPFFPDYGESRQKVEFFLTKLALEKKRELYFIFNYGIFHINPEGQISFVKQVKKHFNPLRRFRFLFRKDDVA